MKKKTKEKAVLTIEVSTKITIHPAKFKPAEYTQYLDKDRLLKAKNVILEIGTIELADGDVPVIATIQKGMITDISLRAMDGCKDCKESDESELSSKAATEILSELKKAKITPLTLPTPLVFSDRSTISIAPMQIISRIHWPPKGKPRGGCYYYVKNGWFCKICWWGYFACVKVERF